MERSGPLPASQPNTSCAPLGPHRPLPASGPQEIQRSALARLKLYIYPFEPVNPRIKCRPADNSGPGPPSPLIYEPLPPASRPPVVNRRIFPGRPFFPIVAEPAARLTGPARPVNPLRDANPFRLVDLRYLLTGCVYARKDRFALPSISGRYSLRGVFLSFL